ncbi:hypothetical protein T484DRAFT_1902658 [Baffinella frigidus]|nr:hypothetical protein T484DRAFT_1902658 [Cryptophyta sp. CCMP2293]
MRSSALLMLSFALYVSRGAVAFLPPFLSAPLLRSSVQPRVPFIRRHRAAMLGVRCMAGAQNGGGEEDTAAMLARLKSGMNTWVDDEGGSGDKGDKLPPKRGGATARPKGGSAPKAAGATKEARVRIEETKAGRKGKTCTVVKGLERLSKEDAKDLLKKIKAKVSVGGSVSEKGELEVQGGHAPLVVNILLDLGYKDVKVQRKRRWISRRCGWPRPRVLPPRHPRRWQLSRRRRCSKPRHSWRSSYRAGG